MAPTQFTVLKKKHMPSPRSEPGTPIPYHDPECTNALDPLAMAPFYD